MYLNDLNKLVDILSGIPAEALHSRLFLSSNKEEEAILSIAMLTNEDEPKDHFHNYTHIEAETLELLCIGSMTAWLGERGYSVCNNSVILFGQNGSH